MTERSAKNALAAVFNEEKKLRSCVVSKIADRLIKPLSAITRWNFEAQITSKVGSDAPLEVSFSTSVDAYAD